MTNTETLLRLIELAEKAGAHEWAVDGDDRPGMEWNNFIVQADKRHMTVCFMAHAEGDNSELEAAAEFIAAAKNAIPHLKALLGEQREAQGAEVPEVTHYQGARVKCTPHMRPIIDLESRDNKFDYFLVRAEVKSAPPLAESVGDVEAAAEELTKELGYSGERAKFVAYIAGVIRRHMQQGK